MPNLGDLLDRESRTVDLAPGDFDRLLDRRERKARQRQIAAGALAAVVMLATVALLLRSFTTVPVDPPAPLVPGPLAYTAYGDLIVADWDGQHPVTVLDGRADEECQEEYFAHGQEIWSPDGRYLAVRRAACPGGAAQDEIVIVEPDGHVVGEFPAEGRRIAWSPDSTRVAAWMEVTRTFGIWNVQGDLDMVVPVDDRLLPECDCDAVWSAGGSFLTMPGVVIPLDGSTPSRLADEDPLSNEDAVISPDGSHVAYVEGGRLFVAAAGGSDPRPLASAFVRDPIWSPTGDRVAYAQGAIDPPEVFEVRIVDVETGDVTVPLGMGGDNSFWPVEFSPDGERILVRRTADHDHLEPMTWIINADGSGATPLVVATTGDWAPVGRS